MWSEGWITKLKDDQAIVKADICVLVSQSLPNDVKDFKFRDGIGATLVENTERISIYAAWNIGIKIAQGKYIMNWNTDDLL